MKVLWVLEDGIGFTPEADLFTTEALIRTFHRTGDIEQHLSSISRILWNGAVTALAVPYQEARIAKTQIDFTGAIQMPVAGFDAVFLRVDPPITERYRHCLIMLGIVEHQTATVFVNSPTAILTRGSKLVNLRFPTALAPGVISADLTTLLEYIVGSDATTFVAKPLDRSSGCGVIRFSREDPAGPKYLNSLLTEYGFVHLQSYLTAVETVGEIRHLVFAGEVLSAWRKVPKAGDFRANLDQGARLEAIDPPIGLDLARHLVEQLWCTVPGFVFLSADFIGESLNEINVENTGGLPAANDLYQRDHALMIADRLMRLVLDRRGTSNPSQWKVSHVLSQF